MKEISPDVVAGAVEAAQRSAERAGVTVRDVVDLKQEAAVSDLFDRVWGAEGQMPSNLIHAVAHAGNYLSGAYQNEVMVGAAFGFLGRTDDEIFLHSHMTGVDPTLQRSGVGFALKLHQRAWALSRGLSRVQWTFDPLVRRNGYFNLVKLGAEIVDYHINFYGDMADEINAGDESDRVVVSWDLMSPRATAASNGKPEEPDVVAFRNAGAVVALDSDDDLHPITGPWDSPLVLCHIPEDVVALRHEDPRAGSEWRRALRETLGLALRNGHRAKAITRTGWYLLEQKTA